MKIVLFDMDGTLTPARKPMESKLLDPIARLQKAGYKVGIISGSDIDYIAEQCELLGDVNAVDPFDIMYFPCNGTKCYAYNKDHFELVYCLDMKDHVGAEEYKTIIRTLLDSQNAVRYGLGGKEVPLSGTFIQYRGTAINWCPIGRDASHEERELWIELDKKHNIRQSLLSRIQSAPVFHNLEVKLGGETSFDIYPPGWNKSYVLSKFADDDEIWFVGDKCTGLGNDKELYDEIKLRIKGESFETKGPSTTIEIINNQILNNPDNL